MEKINLPLSKYTRAQKLDLLETLWSDLTKDEKEFKSPAWHETVLKERESSLSEGKIKISTWDEAKMRIKRNVS